jgi:NADH-quinone oxidoreductase subunit N
VTHALGFVDVGVAASNVSSPNQVMMLLVGIAFILAALAFKLGLAPFHMWVPDVYQGAPAAVTMFLSTAPKIAVVMLLIRVLQTAFVSLAPYSREMLYAIAVLSLLVGNVFALTQRNLRRMLAYSSVAQMGFVLLGVATQTGLSAALFYTMSYAIISAGAFSIIALLNCQGKIVENIDDLAGLNRRHPWLAFMMLLLVVSMAGLPPMVGFIAKLSILMALLQSGQIALAVFAALISVVGLYYYLRVIKVMYFNDEKEKGLVEVSAVTASSVVMISVTGLFALLLGVFPAMLLNYCQAIMR